VATEDFIVRIRGVDATRAAFEEAQRNARRLTDSVGRANASISGMSRTARAQIQQTGYQLQDIAVQLQAGQNPFIILSQQGSQIASAFGPIGAIIGTALAIGGAAATALGSDLFTVTSAMDELEEASGKVDDAMVRIDASTTAASDELQRLAEISQVLAQIKLSAALYDAEDAANAAITGIQEELDGLTNGMMRMIGVAPEIGTSLGALSKMEDPVNALTSALSRYEEAQNALKTQGMRVFTDPDIAAALEYGRAVDALAEELNLSTDRAAEFATTIAQFKVGLPKDVLEGLISNLYEVTEGAPEARRKVSDFVLAFEALLVQSERANQDFSVPTLLKNAQEDSKDATTELERFNEELERLRKTQGMLPDQIELFDLQQLNADPDEITEYLNLKAAQEELENTRDAYVKVRDELLAPTRPEGMSKEMFDLESEFSEQMAVLEAYKDLVPDSYEEVERLKTQIMQEYSNERVRILTEEQAKLAQAQIKMLNDASSGYGQMAEGLKAAAGEQSAAYKAMFAVSKGFAIASATLDMSVALAKAMTLTFPLNIVEYARVAASMGSIMSNIHAVSANFEGGGYTGMGPRTGGVDGRGGFAAIVHPNEIIIDREQAQASMSMAAPQNDITVNLIEDNTRAGQVTQRRDQDDRQIVDVVVASIRGGGPVRSAIQQTYRGLEVMGR